jgi:putative membrane protein
MSVTRQWAGVAGLTLLAALWLGPLPGLTPGSFAAHMTLHMGVMAVAAPLLAVACLSSRGNPGSPVVASAVELIVVWAWHTPLLHEAARQAPAAFILEQGSFLAVGVWLWWAALGARSTPGDHRRWAGVAALIFTSVHMTLLGSLFTFAPRVLYGTHAGHPAALTDQHLGGGIMLLAGGLSYLIGGLILAGHGLRATSARTERAR